MPVIEPKDQSIKGLKGLHLWHTDMSSCSQRVRAVLAEKNLIWESHLLVIPKGDTTTPEFLAINPRGLVPVFVHDGVLMTESMDIIDYLDKTFPVPALRPKDSRELQQMKYWMEIVDKAQYDLKVLSHEFMFRAIREISAKQVEIFENDVENELLVDFVKVYHRSKKLPSDMISKSINKTDRWFQDINTALMDRTCLVGNTLTLADVACMPNVHRFELMDWPLEKYPNVVGWHKYVKESRGYKAGIVDWESAPTRELLSSFVHSRSEEGYHVRNFGELNA